MKVIYKYILNFVEQQELELPANSKILSVKNQNENIVLYALIDNEITIMKTHLIFIKGTGHNADNIKDCNFIETVKLLGGELMFHIFTKKKENLITYPLNPDISSK